MKTTRRNVLKISAAAIAGIALRPLATLANEPIPRATRPLRILILGGTGFIGPDQVRYALARGHKITLFNRGKSKVSWPGTVEALIGDRDTGNLKALEGREWDVCIDNPARLPSWVRDAGHTLRGKVGQYIFISTISAYAKNDVANADESAALEKYSGKDAMQETMQSLHANGQLYGPLKARCEHEAKKRFPGITTIIRPGLIVGPGDPTDRFTYWPVRLERAGEVLAPGSGSDPVQFIDARDLAEWTIRLAEARHFGVFNAMGPNHPQTMHDMLASIAKGIKASEKLTWVPSEFLEKHHVQPWSDLPVWVPPQGEMAGFARRSNHAAIAAGLTFRPLPDTARDTLTWFHTLPAQRQSHLMAGLSAKREAEVLKAWHLRKKTSA